MAGSQGAGDRFGIPAARRGPRRPGRRRQGPRRFTKSYKTARLAETAVALGELYEKRKNIDEAIDYYLQGFAIALNTDEKLDLKSLRRKVGQLYSAKNGSEVGLGDRLLKAHDAYLKEREERLAKLDTPNINTGVGDPLKF